MLYLCYVLFFATHRRDGVPITFKFIYILLLASWFDFELGWWASIFLTLILHSHCQDKINREFNRPVNHYIMYLTLVWVICSMKFFVISNVTNRDAIDQNSLSLKIHLRYECLGYIPIFALNIACYIILDWLRSRTQNTSLVILTTVRFASKTENYETLHCFLDFLENRRNNVGVRWDLHTE